MFSTLNTNSPLGVRSSIFAIIVAGGSGSRMGSEIPKQFLSIHGKPILVHTIEKFLSASSEIQLIIVLPKKDFPIWEKIQRNYFISDWRTRSY